MKISVCIPTFNSAKYLRKCIQSVLAQKNADFEIVVRDNASQDATWEIVRSFSDPRIRIFRADQNQGMASNFNQVVAEAKGDYVKLFCSDDLLEPDALRLQSKFLDDHPEISMVTCATYMIDAEDNLLGTVKQYSRPVIISPTGLRAIALISGNIVREPSAVLFRRHCWLAAGPFQEDRATLIDLDMWFRLSRQGDGVGFLPLALCRIRRHPDSMTNQLRRAGEVQQATLRMSQETLDQLHATWLVRKVGIGRVAGAHLAHSLYGIFHGNLRWPVAALKQSFRMDPGFLGLGLYFVFFRTGLLSLNINREGRAIVSTVSCEEEAKPLRIEKENGSQERVVVSNEKRDEQTVK